MPELQQIIDDPTIAIEPVDWTKIKQSGKRFSELTKEEVEERMTLFHEKRQDERVR